MAYMTPACISTQDNNTAPDHRSIYIYHINVPYRFVVMAGKYMDELNDNLSLVCDGGIDNDVPPLLPQVKVNPMSALLLVLLFYRTLIHLIIAVGLCVEK